MPLNRPPKRPRGDAFAPNKRARVAARGTESQPIDIDKSQQPAQRLSPRKALAITTSQATEPPTFESQLRESQPEAAIVAPTEGSSAATAVITEDDEDSNEDSDKRLDERFADNFDGIDWSRLPLYCKPVSTQKQRKSWIYRYGYRVALIKDPDRLFFVCRYCHQHKWIDARQGGIYETTLSTTSACHLEQVRRGHSLTAPSKTHSITKAGKGGLRALLKAASVKVLQGLANELGGFDCQAFRHAAVAWLIDSNHPLSEFQKPAFRQMLKAANVEAAAALWTSHASVSRYVMRRFDFMLPQVVIDLSKALSKIHISFDGWTTKGGKRGFLGVVAHYVNSAGDLIDLPIALPQLTGAHTGEKIAEVVSKTLQQFGINSRTVGYFMLDNATNNDTAVLSIAQQMDLTAAHRRLRCGAHTLNLIGQALLWGSNNDVYDNDRSELAVESELLRNWREDGPLGVLLSVINYIRTPQQLELFEKFQRIANAELLADQREVLAPVKPVVTRWNSYYSAFERAVKLQPAVNAYAHHHICRVRDEDTYAISRGNKLPEAADWMRSGGLTAADWAVVTEYIDVLKPLKSATKRLEGRGKDTEGRVGGGLYGAIAELDLSPAYYAATLLHPRYKTYCEVAWADKPEWLEANNRTFHELWAEYNTSPRAVRRPKVISNEIDDAIDALLDPDGAVAATDGYMDEYERWKACEPKASKGSYAAVHPIKYWVGLRDRYPSLAQMAIDMLSIPASSCECERMFSELGDLLEPRRRQISPQLLAAI
ncbi:Dimer-Tnp-hAT domain containing protein, partial [Pyrenophora tritici-repentis]